ncbi:hypothetical protein RRSWK_00483 [Rhodopirellula sp. SWK7]|nr:hypothetical protein RRSWK_00483 [Rhodopirellula sp. SWK7]
MPRTHAPVVFCTNDPQNRAGLPPASIKLTLRFESGERLPDGRMRISRLEFTVGNDNVFQHRPRALLS